MSQCPWGILRRVQCHRDVVIIYNHNFGPKWWLVACIVVEMADPGESRSQQQQQQQGLPTAAADLMASSNTTATTMAIPGAIPDSQLQEDNASVSSSSTGSTSSSDSIIAECVLPHHRRLSKMISVPIKMPHDSSAQPSSSTLHPERTYIFPGMSTSVPSGSGVRGHARSVSHGGGSLMATTNPGPMAPITGAARPTALKSALRGHQRAFSQGQIIENTGGMLPGASGSGAGGQITGGSTTIAAGGIPPRSGHNRVGSKTDFILPPGHKDPPQSRDTATTSARVGGGHSRQASRSESIYTLRRAEVPPWWKRMLMFGPHNKPSDECRYRTVVPNHTVPGKTPKRDHPNGRWMGNKIRTTKYTLLSFIPKNLLEQFHRVANLYFLFIVVLNWFPAINAFGKEVAMIPVLFVLGVTAIKDLFEDRRRRASDQRINNTTCRVYCGWVTIKERKIEFIEVWA